MKVSKSDSIYSKLIVQSELLEELIDIRQGKYKTVIQKCRQFTSNKQYDLYKALKVKLPIVIFCGTFSGGRKLENLIGYNNFMILDIDHIVISEINNIKEVLKNDRYIYSVWLSPSGEGLKALVRIESSEIEHKSSFESLKNYFQANYKIELDESGKDITRLCFVSWDEDLYLNLDSDIYIDKENPKDEIKSVAKSTKNTLNKSLNKSAYATEGLNKTEHKKNIILIIKYLKRKDLSVTSTFDKWYKVALSISYTFSYDLGEKYYLSLCELDKDKHNELESINLLKYCYNNRNLNNSSVITLGTLVFYAKEKGFVSKKDKFCKQ